MITILHGDEIVASRQQLSNLINLAKSQGREIIKLDGQKCDFSQIRQALESSSLFVQEKLVVFENLIKRVQKYKDKEIPRYFIKSKIQVDVILWENKEFSQAIIKKFAKNPVVRLFKIPSIAFKFLESLKPHNAKYSLTLLQQYLEAAPAPVIFFMLIRQFRFLFLTKSNNKNGPSDFKKLAFWQKQKLTNQSRWFTIEKLKEIYKKLLEIEYKTKTGKTPFNLKEEIELFILKL